LQSIHYSSRSLRCLIISSGGKKIFADHYLQPFLLKNESLPVELLKMIRHAAFTLVESPYPSELKESIPRMSALTRWFTPWIHHYMETAFYIRDPKERLTSGEKLAQFFNISMYLTQSKLRRRSHPMTEDEIARFKSSMEDIISSTALDLDLIDMLFCENQHKLVDPVYYSIFVFCMQDKIKEIFRISIPEIPVPAIQWLSNLKDNRFF
jgi:serine/threonine protein kinase